MKFDSRLAHTQKIAQAQLKEVTVYDKAELDDSMLYKGTKGGFRVITRSVFPVFSKTRKSTVFPQFDLKTGQRFEIYHTPNAFGPSCTVYYDEYADESLQNPKRGSSPPSEFVKWMDKEYTPVPFEGPKTAHYIDKLDKPTLNFIQNQAKANKNAKIMPELTDAGD